MTAHTAGEAGMDVLLNARLEHRRRQRDHMIRLDAIGMTNPRDPWHGVWVDVTHQNEGAGVLKHDQRLTLAEVLRFDRISNARLHFEEQENGSIEPGKLADLILVDRDPFTCPEDDLKTTRVVGTIVGGQDCLRER
jgi:predicted amidohydrolase YtcJ